MKKFNKDLIGKIAKKVHLYYEGKPTSHHAWADGFNKRGDVKEIITKIIENERIINTNGRTSR